MDSVVGHVAAAVTPQVAPVPPQHRIVRVFRGRPVPHIPVETGRCLGVRFDREVRLALLIEDAAQVDLTEPALVNVLLGGHQVRRRTVLHAHLHDPVVLACGLHGLAAFPAIVALRFFDVHVLAGLAAPDGRQRMPVRRGRNQDGIHRLVVEHLTEILHALGDLPILAGGKPLRPRLEQAGIDVADVGHFAIVAPGESLGDHVTATVAANNGENDLLIGRRGSGRFRIAQDHGTGGHSERCLL